MDGADAVPFFNKKTIVDYYTSTHTEVSPGQSRTFNLDIKADECICVFVTMEDPRDPNSVEQNNDATLIFTDDVAHSNQYSKMRYRFYKISGKKGKTIGFTFNNSGSYGGTSVNYFILNIKSNTTKIVTALTKDKYYVDLTFAFKTDYKIQKFDVVNLRYLEWADTGCLYAGGVFPVVTIFKALDSGTYNVGYNNYHALVELD